jgi:hypothetical protein
MKPINFTGELYRSGQEVRQKRKRKPLARETLFSSLLRRQETRTDMPWA